jgi:hypothetical protein
MLEDSLTPCQRDVRRGDLAIVNGFPYYILHIQLGFITVTSSVHSKDYKTLVQKNDHWQMLNMIEPHHVDFLARECLQWYNNIISMM